jgi:hypothetical protein
VRGGKDRTELSWPWIKFRTLMPNRQRTLELLRELKRYDVIDYRIGEHRPGEFGPHLDVWKGPRFNDGLPAEASAEVRSLFENLCSGEMQRRVDQIERTDA